MVSLERVPTVQAADTPAKLILRSCQSPGDIVVMTAAVRELHRQCPGRFVTDVRTPASAIWEHNPHISKLADGEAGSRTIEMHYPLVNSSNQRPVHFLDGYCDYLAGQLGLPGLRPQEFRGHIYLSDEEKGWINQVEETARYKGRFWLVNAGSKRDFTCKQWPPEYFQAVIDHFRGRVVFAQIGAAEHEHPPLAGAIDLRGKTDHRQLIRLVYHSAGVVTGVSYPMHLAAAVPRPDWMIGLRPCVVVGGAASLRTGSNTRGIITCTPSARSRAARQAVVGNRAPCRWATAITRIATYVSNRKPATRVVCG